MVPSLSGQICNTPIRLGERRSAGDRPFSSDTLQVISPYLAQMQPVECTRVCAPVAEAPPLMATSHTSTFQRFALAGLAGLAVLGGVSVSFTSGLPRVEISQASAQEARPTNSVGNTQQAAPRPTSAGNEQQTAPRGSGQIRVFGQDVGGQTEEVPGVTWETYRGTYHGQSFSIEYPHGWRVTRIFDGIAVVDPADAETMTVFMWRSGQGNMTPSGLIGQLLSESHATNVRFLESTPSGPASTPLGPVYSLEADVTYNSPEGDRLRAEMTSAVSNAPNSYVPFWNGNIVALQSDAAEFNENAPVLRHVAESFTPS